MFTHIQYHTYASGPPREYKTSWDDERPFLSLLSNSQHSSTNIQIHENGIYKKKFSLVTEICKKMWCTTNNINPKKIFQSLIQEMLYTCYGIGALTTAFKTHYKDKWYADPNYRCDITRTEVSMSVRHTISVSSDNGTAYFLWNKAYCYHKFPLYICKSFKLKDLSAILLSNTSRLLKKQARAVRQPKKIMIKKSTYKKNACARQNPCCSHCSILNLHVKYRKYSAILIWFQSSQVQSPPLGQVHRESSVFYLGSPSLLRRENWFRSLQFTITDTHIIKQGIQKLMSML